MIVLNIYLVHLHVHLKAVLRFRKKIGYGREEKPPVTKVTPSVNPICHMTVPAFVAVTAAKREKES